MRRFALVGAVLTMGSVLGVLRVGEASGRSDERSFAPPPRRPGDVAREAILARIATEHARRIVLIDGPAGYGKTTFAAQACARDGRLLRGSP